MLYTLEDITTNSDGYCGYLHADGQRIATVTARHGMLPTCKFVDNHVREALRSQLAQIMVIEGGRLTLPMLVDSLRASSLSTSDTPSKGIQIP